MSTRPTLPAEIEALTLDAVLLSRAEGVTLKAAWRVSARTFARYEPVSQAIRVVAVHPDSGRTYWTSFQRAGSRPLRVVLDPPTEGPVLSFDGQRDVELVESLGLPKDGQVYQLFLWLDELASPIRRLIAPGERSQPPSPEHVCPDSLSFEVADPPAPGALAFDPLSNTLRGCLPQSPMAESLTVLALAQRSDRAIRALSVALPEDPGLRAFELNVAELGLEERPERWFARAIVHGALSESVALDPTPFGHAGIAFRA